MTAGSEAAFDAEELAELPGEYYMPDRPSASIWHMETVPERAAREWAEAPRQLKMPKDADSPYIFFCCCRNPKSVHSGIFLQIVKSIFGN